jgi:RimJ/RimL family protein N-acetyltransferase
MTVLRTPHLLLRPPRSDDAVHIADLINNERISRNLARVPFPCTLDDVRNWLAVLSHEAHNAHVFALTRAGKPVGVIGLEGDDPGDAAELGYWLGEPWWRGGWMSEAAVAVVGHGFEGLRFERVTAGYRHGNEASRRLLLSLGFRITGHTRMFSRGARATVDVARTEITRREWLRGGGR